MLKLDNVSCWVNLLMYVKPKSKKESSRDGSFFVVDFTGCL